MKETVKDHTVKLQTLLATLLVNGYNLSKVERISRFVFRIVLIQGLNRQIRRMCEYLGYEVEELRRERIMNIELGNLPIGKWRNLTDAELQGLKNAVSKSDNSSFVDSTQKQNDTPRKRRGSRNS